MVDETWGTLDWLQKDVPTYPLAAPALRLLREAQPKWEGKVALGASLRDYLIFYRRGEAFPWETEVRLSYTDGALEFQLLRDRYHVITADRAKPENAYAVLDAFLMQLTGTT